MNLQIVKWGMDFSNKKKKWLLLVAFFGVPSYNFYKVYHLPLVVRKRERILKLLRALISLAEMVSNSAETISILPKT